MLMSQSTTVLANRLTQVALYPQEYTYVKIYPSNLQNYKIKLKPHCGMKKLDFFKQYTTEECHVECSYKAVMDKCKCWPPYFPIYKKEYPMCTFSEHARCISIEYNSFNYSTCGDCPKPCHDLVYNRNVEYGKFHEPIQRVIKKYQKVNQRLGIATSNFSFQILWKFQIEFGRNWSVSNLLSLPRCHFTSRAGRLLNDSVCKRAWRCRGTLSRGLLNFCHQNHRPSFHPGSKALRRCRSGIFVCCPKS